MTDNLDGTVTCRYTPTSADPVQVRVQVLGGHVPGSPFAVEPTDGIPLAFESAFDTNGVLHWIGTEGGTRVYANPHTAGRVVAAMSSVGGSGTSEYDAPHRFVQHEPDGRRNLTRDIPNSWMSVDLGEGRRLAPNHYCLRHSNNTSSVLRNWRLEGSNDGAAWTTLRAHNNDATLPSGVRFGTGAWEVEGGGEDGRGGGYRHFRILSTGTNSGGHHYVMCAGIELYGTLVVTD